MTTKLGRKRLFYLMYVDVESCADEVGRITDTPLHEPVALGITSSEVTAERALGCLVEDRARSVVRTTVDTLPKILQDSIAAESDSSVNTILSMVDLPKRD